MRRLVMTAKKPSTALIHDAEVGVKWIAQRGWSATRILSSGLRQVELVGNGQAGVVVRYREAHRHLTIALLAPLSTGLPGHPERVSDLLWEGPAVDHPVAHRAMLLDGRQHLLAH